jgi:hypothetical protein
MIMNFGKLKFCLLIIVTAGCTHSTSPSNPPSRPGPGSSYTFVAYTTINSQSTVDTTVYTVDSVSLSFMGRNNVSRIVLTKNNRIQDTFYISYLTSGDIETYTQSYYTGPAPWIYYPFASQRNSMTVFDTSWTFGPQIHSLYDTTNFIPAGSGSQSIQGSTLADERVNATVSVISEGEAGFGHGIYSYIPSIGFLGFAVDTAFNGGRASIASQQLLSYHLE